MSKVLLVDDNSEIRMVMKMYLKRAGHEVVDAEDGADALAKLDESGEVDVAVLDVAMPGMTGLELLVRLRERPELTGLPAVFVSARGKAEDIARGTALGAEYIVKPFTGEQLTSVVDELLTPEADVAC